MTDGAGPDGGPRPDAEAEVAGDASARGGGWQSAQATEGGPDLRQLAADWISLWQSELSAIAVDREAQETWQAMLVLWAGAAGAMLQAMPRNPPAGPPAGHDRATRRTGTEPEARAPTPAAAPDPRDVEIDRLARHVAALEARLAGLERGDRGGPAGEPRKRKR